MRRILRAIGMSAVALAATARLAPAQGMRPLTPEDLVRSDGLFPSGLSPDGKALLYLRIPRFGHPLPKLFLADLDGGTEREVTREIDPRARILVAAWSPSGRRYAVIATIGPVTRVWVGDRDSGRLARISHPPLRTASPPPLAWASEDELILATIPDGAIGFVLQAEDLTAQQWAKTNEGMQPSRSVVENGAKAEASPGRQGSWTLLDLRDGSIKTAPCGAIPTRTVASRDGRSIAALSHAAPPRIDLRGLLPAGQNPNDLDLEVAAVVRGGLAVRRVGGVADVQGDSLSWSLDGTKLAFMARKIRGGPEPGAFVFDVAGGTVAEMNVEGVAGTVGPDPFAWSIRGTLTAMMRTKAPGAIPGGPEWWTLRADAPPANLTARLDPGAMRMPSALVAEPSGTLLGVVGSGLWRLDPDGGPAVRLGERLPLSEARLEWPLNNRLSGRVLVSAKRGEGRILGRFDPEDGGFAEVTRPTSDALLNDFHPETGTAVFTVLSGRESSLWSCSSAREGPRQVAEANSHVHDVAEPVLEAIRYKDADGNDLLGWLAMPPGCDRGRRHSLIAYVYPGTVFSDRARPRLDDAVELLVGRGHVVLLPSMPRPAGPPTDPYDTLAKQVMPAVDRAVEIGIADTERLGLMGHSFGGYAVYGIVTQTRRFRAAVASAGLTDLVSYYGQFHARTVRGDAPLDELHSLTWSETGQGRLGVPLWEDPAKYVRNSPIHYVGGVETPLLMLHGDLDFVPIQQAEEFYTSLARRGKRARFVRYWGEGHVIYMSPANYLDYWREVFKWFETL